MDVEIMNGVSANMQQCPDCNKIYSRKAAVCPYCGAPSPLFRDQKERLIYIILALFVGGFGIHNFYSGHIGKGIAKIILTLLVFTSFIAWIWCIVEICTVKEDANGVPFK